MDLALRILDMLRRYRASSSYLPLLHKRYRFLCFVGTALRAATYLHHPADQVIGQLRRYRASSCYLPMSLWGACRILLRRYRASSCYLPVTSRLRTWCVLRRYRASSSHLPCHFPLRAISLLRRDRASSCYLPSSSDWRLQHVASQVPRFGQLLTLLCIILRMDIASWVPRLEQLLTAKLCSHPRTQASQVWRFERLLTKHKYGLSHSYASQTPHFEQILISQGSQSHGRTCFAGIVFRAIAISGNCFTDAGISRHAKWLRRFFDRCDSQLRPG